MQCFHRVDLCHQAKDEEEDDENGISESFLEKAITKPGPLHLDSRRRCCSFWNIHVGSRQKFVVLVHVNSDVLAFSWPCTSFHYWYQLQYSYVVQLLNAIYLDNHISKFVIIGYLISVTYRYNMYLLSCRLSCCLLS